MIDPEAFGKGVLIIGVLIGLVIAAALLGGGWLIHFVAQHVRWI